MGNIRKERREMFNEYMNGIELVQSCAHINTILKTSLGQLSSRSLVTGDLDAGSWFLNQLENLQ